MIKQIVSIGVVGLALISAVVFAAFTQTDATRGGGKDKITICHATNSASNPYESIEVNQSAADGISGNNNGKGDHYSEHTGPLAYSEAYAAQLKQEKIDWGDIIPPIDGIHQGRNWTELGQAIYNNDCNIPSKVATASVSTIPATCESGETLVYGDIKQATFSGTPDGTKGPGSYNVVATAKKNALFAGNLTTKTFNGALSGPLTGEQCDETEYDTAVAGVRFIAATCQVGEQLLYGEEDLANARFDEASTPSGTFGPADYTVTAYADENAEFAPADNVSEGGYILVLSGELSGPLTGEECEETEFRTATASVRIIAATCETPGQLLYGDEDVLYASFDGTTPSGTTGPADYEVIAYAFKDARFAEGEGVSEDGTVKTITGTLEGTLTGDDCVLGETPETPEVLPETNAATPLALIAAFSATAAAVAGLGFGLRSALGRKL